MERQYLVRCRYLPRPRWPCHRARCSPAQRPARVALLSSATGTRLAVVGHQQPVATDRFLMVNAKGFLRRAPAPSRCQVEIHGDKFDGPSAFLAQRGSRVHGCDAQRLVLAVRVDDE